MKRLLIPLLAALALPTAVKADAIPKITDYELGYKKEKKSNLNVQEKESKIKKQKKLR